IFAETGFVVTPFLTGDSLLFATGALAATGAFSLPLAFVLLAVAAFTGNAVNYAVGRLVGPRVFTAAPGTGISGRLLNRDHLNRLRLGAAHGVRVPVTPALGEAQAVIALRQADHLGRGGPACLPRGRHLAGC